MNKTLVQFSVDTYKPGDKVITRDGQLVTILSTARAGSDYLVVGQIGTSSGVSFWAKDGVFCRNNQGTSHLNLFIQKERQLIPFDMSDAESIIGKAVKHKVHDRVSLITDFTSLSTGAYIQVGTLMVRQSTLLNDFVFLDGSPCGKYA